MAFGALDLASNLQWSRMSAPGTDPVDGQAAPAASKWICLYNETPIDPATGHCYDPSHTHCPFCGSCGYVDRCWHLLAAESVDADQGWATAPFDPLPYLDEACDCVWPEQQLREVFGEAYPLLTYY